jgi:hypothetical protein
VNADQSFVADVLTKDGLIAAVASNLEVRSLNTTTSLSSRRSKHSTLSGCFCSVTHTRPSCRLTVCCLCALTPLGLGACRPLQVPEPSPQLASMCCPEVLIPIHTWNFLSWGKSRMKTLSGTAHMYVTHILQSWFCDARSCGSFDFTVCHFDLVWGAACTEKVATACSAHQTLC